MSEIILVGRPNVGKSYLFNSLTGSHQKVGNFAGVTLEKKSKALNGTELIVTDLPGIYGLNVTTEDEKVTYKHLSESAPDDLICVVIECLKLKTQIPYILELRTWCETNCRPMIVCLNMKDEADYYSIEFNIPSLSEILKVPVFLVSAKTQDGFKLLNKFLREMNWSAPEPLATSENEIMSKLKNTIRGDLAKVLIGQTKLDALFLAPFLGPMLFLVLTFVLFQAIFSWAEPFMNGVEFIISKLSLVVSPRFSGSLQSFMDNAVFAGFGAFLVFTPQIFILTFILTFLEKSGYMARAVLLCHQPLSWFGLHGKSFIPIMTGHACAVPAIYATRNIENQWIRKLTVFVLPLTVCSARIPVYALLIKVLIPNRTTFYGLFGLQGLVFALMYFFGIFLALILSALITKWVDRENVNKDFIVELPQYRWPEVQVLFSKALKTTWDFIKDAGPIIFILNAMIWALSSLPAGSADLKSSYLAQIGLFLEPLFRPIGLDWIQGVAVLSSFVAREVFVSTLGLLYGLNSDNPNDIINIDQIQNIGFASGVSLLCFFAIALQCMSTVSVMAKEIGSKLAYTALGFYLLFAYMVSFTMYQILK